jgi:hypothetical protein
MELPTFAPENVKLAYQELKSCLLANLEISPIFWNWVSAGFLTKPTLKKILNLEKLLVDTKDVPGEIFEFGSGLGTKAFVLLNLQGALNQTISKVHAFDHFQGHQTTGSLSLAKHRRQIVYGYSKMHEIMKETMGIHQEQEILSLDQADLSAISGEWEAYDGSIRLCFIDVQSGSVSLKLLDWASSRMAANGVIVVEGFESPFFPEVTQFLIGFEARDGFKKIDLDWDMTFAIKKLY